MIRINLEQGTREWKRWRMQGLGGSDAGAIWARRRKDPSLWPYEPAWSLLRQKVKATEKETDFAMRRGTRLEPQAREMYALERSCSAVPMCGEHRQQRWLKASLDGVVTPIGGGRPWLIEVKCPAWQWHNYALAGVVPPIYQAQCQHVLYVSGLDRLDYVSFNNGKRFAESDWLAVVEVRPDPEMLFDLLDAERAFWARVTSWRRRHGGNEIQNAGPAVAA